MARAHLEPGIVIDGFRLEAEVHRGGMAAIWRVTKPGLDFPIVMKVPFLDQHKGELSLIVGFEVEQLIMPRLTGPHVPRHVASGDLSVQPYIVMEHVEGTTLKALVEKMPFGLDNPFPHALALAEALADLHRQKVLHLDLKPANVIYRPSGVAVIIDFGLSRHLELPDLLGEQYRRAIGTTDTMAPEQLAWVRSDPRSDIFAFGTILYKMSTGQLPFGSPLRVSEVKERVWQDPLPPRAVRADVSPALQEIILKCLEPMPDKRYASVDDLVFDLRNPDLVELSDHGQRSSRSSYVSQLGRRIRATDLLEAIKAAAAKPPPKPPILLVAVDMSPDAAAIRDTLLETAVSVLANMPGARLACISVKETSAIAPAKNVDKAGDNIHVAQMALLRAWAAPLELPPEKLTCHLIEARSFAKGVLDFATANAVEHLVTDATSKGGKQLLAALTSKPPCPFTVARA